MPHEVLQAVFNDLRTVMSDLDFEKIYLRPAKKEDYERFMHVRNFVEGIIANRKTPGLWNAKINGSLSYFAGKDADEPLFAISGALNHYVGLPDDPLYKDVPNRVEAAWEKGKVGDQTFPPLNDLLVQSLKNARGAERGAG